METIDQAILISPDLLPPTPAEVDQSVAEYDAARAAAETAKAEADAAKDRLIFLVDTFGHAPAGAPQSKRLAGQRNAATITRGNSVTVFESAVLDLQLACVRYVGLFARLFKPQTKHVLQENASDALRALDVPDRTREKLFGLFGKCFDVKTSAPSLKVTVIKPEKPAKKPRAGKAVA